MSSSGHYKPRHKGRSRRLDYDLIRSLIDAGNKTYVQIAREAGCNPHHIWRLKKAWGLIPDRWAVEA